MIEEKEDFFEQTPEELPRREKAPKPPRYRDDDPRYYEQEESRWEHLKPSPYRRSPMLWIILAAVVVICCLLGIYVYVFTPERDHAVQYGYVDEIHREGKVFSSFEGVLLPYKSLMDTVRPYEGDFVFSVRNDSVATQILRRRDSGRPVRVGYKVYRFALPWRGNSKILVTDVDTSVSPSVMLPPDRQPEIFNARSRQASPADQ